MNIKEQFEKNWVTIVGFLIMSVMAYANITYTLNYYQERLDRTEEDIKEIKNEQDEYKDLQVEKYQEIIQRLSRIEEKLNKE